MTDLTVVILTKNEEKNLRKCVESFRGVAKRFVIVDSFSTDGTEALCKELNTELQKIGSGLDFYQNKWVSYADQLNWGLQNTGIDTEWSMRMDADEEIMKDLAAEIDERLPKVKAPVNGIILRRRVYFMGRWIKHGGRYPELLLRIFRTGKASCEMKIMDEHMILSEGTTVEFKHDLMMFAEKVLTTPGMLDSLITNFNGGRKYLVNSLDKNGYRHKGEAGNFIFIEPKTDAQTIVDRMKAEKKILIKAYPNVGEFGNCLRVSIGEEKYMKQFVEALLEIDR